MREIKDTWGVTKEATAGIVPESWLEWSRGEEGGLNPNPKRLTNMLTAHYAVRTNLRQAQQKLGKLVKKGRHAAHTVSPEKLQETARPPWTG